MKTLIKNGLVVNATGTGLADVLIDGGAELEIGWLPPLLQNARNPKLEVGQPGRVQASQGVRLMNVPTALTRAAGDVHVLGNPHFVIDPIIAQQGADRLAVQLPGISDPNRKYELNDMARGDGKLMISQADYSHFKVGESVTKLLISANVAAEVRPSP